MCGFVDIWQPVDVVLLHIHVHLVRNCQNVDVVTRHLDCRFAAVDVQKDTVLCTF